MGLGVGVYDGRGWHQLSVCQVNGDGGNSGIRFLECTSPCLRERSKRHEMLGIESVLDNDIRLLNRRGRHGRRHAFDRRSATLGHT